MQHKFFRVDQSQDRVGDVYQTPPQGNNPTASSVIVRPHTSQPTRSHIQDETMKIFRVKPKLLSKKAFPKETTEVEQKDLLENNFFLQSQPLLDKLDQADKGPKLDDRGQILKYTLVGSVQGFIKEQKQRQMILSPTHKVSIRASNLDDSQETQRQSNIDRSHLSHSKLSMEKKKKKDIHQPYNEIMMNTQEVQLEIKKCQVQVKAAQIKSENHLRQTYSNLSKGDRLQMTAFERIKENYSRHVGNWEHDENRVSEVVGKKPEDSIYRKSEQMRTNNEIKNLLDAITPDYEKYGDRAWQHDLRNPKSSIMDANPYEFVESNKPFIDKKCPIIEIIRKPQSSQLKSRYEGKNPYTSFTSGIHYEKRLEPHKHEMIKLVQCNLDEVAGLEVHGKSILKQEIDAVQRMAGQQGRFVKKQLKEEQPEQLHKHPPQIVDVKWDRQYLLKTGKFALAKTSFFLNE